MIELKNDSLQFSFPEVHPGAKLTIDFQRTLRIPDDDNTYPLPPGLGRFPLRHVDDFAKKTPAQWIQHGGVMLPMYQSEAMWLYFSAHEVDEHWVPYPFAIKIATGKVNAVSGEEWKTGLHRDPQDYVVAPEQPWLDGYCVEKGFIRQFVAMPLGAGYTAEEQLTQQAETGGMQLEVYPMKRDAFERRFPKRVRPDEFPLQFALGPCLAKSVAPGMGLAPGGRMRQEVYDDPFYLDEWALDQPTRCFVHLANSLVWRAITSSDPPTTPWTAKEYTRAGLPWFDYYDDAASAVAGSLDLQGLKSVATMGKEKGGVPLPENESCTPERIIELRRGLRKHQVRETVF